MSSDFSDESDSDYVEENEDEDENENEEKKEEFPTLTTIESVPEKSKTKYLNNYDKFKDWCTEKNSTRTDPEHYHNGLTDGTTTITTDADYSEPIFLEYFTEQSKILKPSSLWVMYSMLRMMMLINHQIDMSKYTGLKSMLRQLSTDYDLKKPLLGETKIFEKEQITRFLLDAPDHSYLLCKVTLIFGIFGACGTGDFPRITTDDVHDTDDILIVTVPPSDRTFVIRRRSLTTTGSEDLVDYAAIYRRYAKLRPPSVKTKRVFLNYQNGRCTSQVVGRNTFGKMPRKMAQFLKLPDYSKFTGCCFRKTAHAHEYYAHARYKSRKRSNRRRDEIIQQIPQQEQNPRIEEDERFRRIYDQQNMLQILAPAQNEEEDELLQMLSTPEIIKPTTVSPPSTTPHLHFDMETNTLTLPGMTVPLSAVKSAAQTINSHCAQLTINFYPLPEVPFCLDHVTYSCKLSSMEHFREIYEIITQALAHAQQNNFITLKSERINE